MAAYEFVASRDFDIGDTISVLGFTLSTVLGIWLLWSVIRSGRL